MSGFRLNSEILHFELGNKDDMLLDNVLFIWGFPKMGVPQNGWFVMEHLIKLDDLEVPLFSETSI